MQKVVAVRGMSDNGGGEEEQIASGTGVREQISRGAAVREVNSVSEPGRRLGDGPDRRMTAPAGPPFHLKNNNVQKFLNNIPSYLSKHKSLVEGTVVTGGKIASEFFGGLVLMLSRPAVSWPASPAPWWPCPSWP